MTPPKQSKLALVSGSDLRPCPWCHQPPQPQAVRIDCAGAGVGCYLVGCVNESCDVQPVTRPFADDEGGTIAAARAWNSYEVKGKKK
jgi:hypothetical protein